MVGIQQTPFELKKKNELKNWKFKFFGNKDHTYCMWPWKTDLRSTVHTYTEVMWELSHLCICRKCDEQKESSVLILGQRVWIARSWTCPTNMYFRWLKQCFQNWDVSHHISRFSWEKSEDHVSQIWTAPWQQVVGAEEQLKMLNSWGCPLQVTGVPVGPCYLTCCAHLCYLPGPVRHLSLHFPVQINPSIHCIQTA